MKNKEFGLIVNGLLPRLPAPLAVEGPLVVLRPMRHILSAICFDPSGFDVNSFYLWVFQMLLCVPSRHIVLTLGRRLRFDGSDGWDRNDPELSCKLLKTIVRDALPRLEQTRSLSAFAKSAKRFRGYPPDPNIQQTFAFALVRDGRTICALKELKCLTKLSDSEIAWERAIAERASVLIARINEGPESSDRLLDSWERETAQKLGLAELLSADNPAAPSSVE